MQILRINGEWHINGVSVHSPNVSEDTINEWGYFLYDHRETNPQFEEVYQLVLKRQFEINSDTELQHYKHADVKIIVPQLVAAGLIASAEWIKAA